MNRKQQKTYELLNRRAERHAETFCIEIEKKEIEVIEDEHIMITFVFSPYAEAWIYLVGPKGGINSAYGKGA